MACFGFSQEDLNENQVEVEKELVKTNGLKKKKNKSGWISWPRIFRPIKSGARTVPVDISMSGNLDPNATILLSKPHKNASSNKLTQSIGVNATHKKKLGALEEITLENSEKNHSTPLAKDEKKLPTRKKETKKTGSTPPKNTHISSGATTTSPPPRRQKKLQKVTTNVGVNEKGVDSIVGMSVIILILGIMLFWGKLCAILCTCAWFYMIPMLRPALDSNVIVKSGPDNDSGVPDLDSDEYKKRVVLEGLLRRNRRTTMGVL